MPGLKEIKRRIGSVKSTRQITKAIKMVSAAKFKKALSRIIELKPFAEKMNAVVISLSKIREEGHPLLQVRDVKKVELVVLTGDKGLCGAYNSNVIKAAIRIANDLKKNNIEVSVSSIGKKSADLLRRKNFDIRKKWIGLSGGRVHYSDAQIIAKDIIENYVNKVFDEVRFVYTEFKSQSVQKVALLRVLPFVWTDDKKEGERDEAIGEYLYEPSQQAILETLLPKNLEIQVFRTILDSQASEDAMRMAAMENATKNANDMIKKLTLQYNKIRQDSITKELMDIVGGVEALKK